MMISVHATGIAITWGQLVMSDLGPGHRECLGGLQSIIIGWPRGVALFGFYTPGPKDRDVRPEELPNCVKAAPEPKRLGPFAYKPNHLLAPGWSVAEAA